MNEIARRAGVFEQPMAATIVARARAPGSTIVHVSGTAVEVCDHLQRLGRTWREAEAWCIALAVVVGRIGKAERARLWAVAGKLESFGVFVLFTPSVYRLLRGSPS